MWPYNLNLRIGNPVLLRNLLLCSHHKMRYGCITWTAEILSLTHQREGCIRLHAMTEGAH